MKQRILMLHFFCTCTILCAVDFSGSREDFYGYSVYKTEIQGKKIQILSPQEFEAGKRWIIASRLYSAENPDFVQLHKFQLEMARRGFAIVACKDIDLEAIHTQMTRRYEMNFEAILMGAGKEAFAVLRQASEHSKKVSCIYLDKGVIKDKGSPKIINKLAENRIAVIYARGGKDTVAEYKDNAALFVEPYSQRSLFFRQLVNKKQGHLPYGVKDLYSVVRLIYMNSYEIAPTHSRVHYGPEISQELDFWQAKSDKPTPVVVHIHGGGWTTGTRRSVSGIKKYLENGISVASVSYRFISQVKGSIKPPVKAPMYDCARAIQFIRSKAGDWNINKKKIALTGGSAGACTSLWLAFHSNLANPESPSPVERESTIPFCVAAAAPQTSLDPQQMKEWIPNSIYGAHAFGLANFKSFIKNRNQIMPWIKEYSPYALASSGAPEIYISYGDPPAIGKKQKDPTHSANFGLKLKERLDELGVPCELVYKGATNVKHKGISQYLIHKLK